MNLVILGAHGMLGHALMGTFSKERAKGLDADELDITNETAVRQGLGALRPDVIINAAAYTNVDACEDPLQYPRAVAVNATAVGTLASFAKENNALLVHYSTDYVFDGENPIGYRVDDRRNPVNGYGRSKAEGEKLLLMSDARFLLIRTSWLFGPFGKNFVDTICAKAQTVPELAVVNDQFGSPTFTQDLAEHTKQLLARRAEGIHHATNSGTTTWFQFAVEALRLSGISTPVKPITSDQLTRAARRPRYSILLNTKDAPLRPWQEALAEYLHVQQGSVTAKTT